MRLRWIESAAAADLRSDKPGVRVSLRAVRHETRAAARVHSYRDRFGAGRSNRGYVVRAGNVTTPARRELSAEMAPRVPPRGNIPETGRAMTAQVCCEV